MVPRKNYIHDLSRKKLLDLVVGSKQQVTDSVKAALQSAWSAPLQYLDRSAGNGLEKPPKMGPSSSIFVDRIFHEKKQAFWGYPYFWKIRENPICLDSSLDMFILTSHQQKYVAGSLRFLCRFPEIIWRFH